MPSESDFLERVPLLPHKDPDCTGRWQWHSIFDAEGKRLPYSVTDRLGDRAWCRTCGAEYDDYFALPVCFS